MTFLFVGLDYEDPSKVADFAEELAEVDRDDFGFKLNLDFFFSCLIGDLYGNNGPLIRIADLGKPIFADLKMWNGRRTMESVVSSLSFVGTAYTNVYAHAGEDFLKEVVEVAGETGDMKVLGLTVLTHYTDQDCQRIYGRSLRDSVRTLAETVHKGGCQGVILPGTSLDIVADLPLEKMVPAVRPKWYGLTGDNYQEQEIYIGDAIKAGADLTVCSSPIRKSKNRKEALVRTLDEMY